MATAVYGTDLALIDDAEAVANYSALGGGAAGLSGETDYFIENTQCVSKAGFTASTRGFILNTGTRTVAAGDAVFVWSKQNNRNLVDTIANGGIRVVIGNDASNYDHFYVDGSDSSGSALAGWRTYAIDPTQTPSTTTGTVTTADRVGMLWKVLGSGALKGNPNGLDVTRHGRELQVTEGFTVAFGTFDGAATFDSATARAWGLLTPVQGGYIFHGNFVMGTTATAVDFRDSNRNIAVLDDEFVPSTFNEFEIRNASSNVEWTNIQIQALGTVSPFILTLDVGTFTGDACFFTGGGTTIFNSSGSMINSTWLNCQVITAAGADLTGSRVSNPNVAANASALIWNVATDPNGLLDAMTFEMGATATHAIEFGLTSPLTINLVDMVFSGYNTTTDNQNDSTFHIKRTTGTVTINISGSGTTASNLTYRSDGATVVIQQNVTLTFDKMKDSSEVRVYAAGTKTELTGIENATAGTADNRNFPASLGAGTSVDYTIVNELYEIIRVEGFTWPSTNQTLNIAQRFDRNFSDPA